MASKYHLVCLFAKLPAGSASTDRSYQDLIDASQKAMHSLSQDAEGATVELHANPSAGLAEMAVWDQAMAAARKVAADFGVDEARRNSQ